MLESVLDGISVPTGPTLDPWFNGNGLSEKVKNYKYPWSYTHPKTAEFLNNAANAVPGVISFGQNLYNSATFNLTSDDLLASANRYNSSVGEFGYNQIGSIDKPKVDVAGGILSGAASGAAAGGMFGGIGAVLGGALGGVGGAIAGIFKKRSANKAFARAEDNRMFSNEMAREGGVSDMLQHNFNKEYRLMNNLVLHAENGIDSAQGLPVMTTPREVKVSQNGIGYIEPGVGNKDTTLDFLKDGESILSKKGPDFAGLARPIVLMQQQLSQAAQNIMAAVKKNKGKNEEIASNVAAPLLKEIKQKFNDSLDELKYLTYMQPVARANGELPESEMAHARWGIDSNDLVGLTGGLLGLSQWNYGRRQNVKRPYSYYSNYQAPAALADLDSLAINEQPIINSIYNNESRGRYAINTSGGLSGAQKYLANVAITKNTQDALSQALTNIQALNNQYRSAADTARLNHGAQEAANMAAASRYDLDYYSKAHAARLQEMQTGLFNAMNAYEQWLKNRNNYRMYEKMYRLYSDDLKSRLG